MLRLSVNSYFECKNTKYSTYLHILSCSLIALTSTKSLFHYKLPVITDIDTLGSMGKSRTFAYCHP